MTTEERFEMLEKELTETNAGLAAAKRLIRQLIAGAGIVMLICIVVVAARSMTGVAHSQAGGNTAEVIQAERFEVVDDQGRILTVLGMNEAGSGLGLSDEKGTGRAGLSVNDAGPILTLSDEKGKTSASLVVTKNRPSLSLYDEKGTDRVWLSVSENGPALSLRDAKGKVLWRAP